MRYFGFFLIVFSFYAACQTKVSFPATSYDPIQKFLTRTNSDVQPSMKSKSDSNCSFGIQRTVFLTIASPPRYLPLAILRVSTPCCQLLLVLPTKACIPRRCFLQDSLRLLLHLTACLVKCIDQCDDRGGGYYRHRASNDHIAS